MRHLSPEFAVASAEDVAAIELFHVKLQFAMARSILGSSYPAIERHNSDESRRTTNPGSEIPSS
jgi:hypothetical protein